MKRFRVRVKYTQTTVVEDPVWAETREEAMEAALAEKCNGWHYEVIKTTETSEVVEVEELKGEGEGGGL